MGHAFAADEPRHRMTQPARRQRSGGGPSWQDAEPAAAGEVTAHQMLVVTKPDPFRVLQLEHLEVHHRAKGGRPPSAAQATEPFPQNRPDQLDVSDLVELFERGSSPRQGPRG
jgi:hypothetical protein